MIFNEIYSVYYNVVAKILEMCLLGDVTEKEIKEYIKANAFPESLVSILPSLKKGDWWLLEKNMTPVIKNAPTIPLTEIQKKWLKAISMDPRIKLFDIDFSFLSDTPPLFLPTDYKVFDKYSDGDDFEDADYIANFRKIYNAVKSKTPVKVLYKNQHGDMLKLCFYPCGFEYSEKDDKIRVLADKFKYRYFNLSRIISVESCNDADVCCDGEFCESIKELTLEIYDERNALERVLLHFSHFEREAEKIDDNKYVLRLKYYESDETEIVIRVLSFGHAVKVTSPESFVELIRKRLSDQRRFVL